MLAFRMDNIRVKHVLRFQLKVLIIDQDLIKMSIYFKLMKIFLEEQLLDKSQELMKIFHRYDVVN